MINSINRTSIPKDFFTRAELDKFRNCSQAKLILDLLLIWAQAIIGVLIIVFGANLLFVIVGIFVVGSAQHGMGLVTHEGAHTLLSTSRLRNDFMSRWFFAAPVLLPFNLYRRRHFLHHQFACTEADTKELYRQKITGLFFILEILKSLIGVDFLKQVISVLGGLGRGSKKISNQSALEVSSIIYDFLSILVVQILIFFTFMMTCGWTYYFIAWLIPLVTVNMLCGKLRSIVEHQPTVKDSHGALDSKYFKGMNTPFSRSINPTIFEKIFLTKINFSYHAEHHLFPSISYQFLPLVRDRISMFDKNILFISGYSYEKSYFRVLCSLVFDSD